jgi:hypothetical protein
MALRLVSLEIRTPAEMVNLLTLDALIATHGMDADELVDLHAPGALALPGWRSGDPTTGPLPP